MISFRQKGDFSKLTRFLEKAKEAVRLGDLDKYGREGVAALASATPVDSGLTARSWHYKIENRKGSVAISFYNSNVQNGVSIAVILQYGHGTRTGGWVAGRDYINPAIQPVFDKIANEAWREVIVRNTEFYDAARDMVAGFANGISANTFLAEAKAAEMAAAAARAARRELDEHSPSKVGYEIGDFFGVAFVGAIGDYADKSYRAGAEMGSKARIGLTEAVSKISDYINSDIDAQPTIRPVLDLSNVQSGTRQINAMFSRTQAMSINANMSRAHTSGNQNGGFQDGSAATYNYFTQNNYSPKALSRVEIYRQTKNQFSAMKGTVSKR